jgi:hypothetical protein
MVQQVVIPLSALNQVLPTQDFADVEFAVPEVGDIVDPILAPLEDLQDTAEDIVADLLTLPEVQTAVEDVLEDVEQGDPLIEAIAEAVVEGVAAEITGLEDIEIPDADAIADAIADEVDLEGITEIEVDIEGSLFDVEQDLIPIIEELFEEADLSGLVGDLPIPAELPALVSRLMELLDRFEAEIDAFLDDPVPTAASWLLTLLRATAAEANLVSDAASNNLEAAAEDV